MKDSGRLKTIVICILMSLVLLSVASCGIRNDPDPASRDGQEAEESSGAGDISKAAGNDSEEDQGSIVAVAEFRYLRPAVRLADNGGIYPYTLDGDFLYYVDYVNRKEEDGTENEYVQVGRYRISDGSLEEDYIVSDKGRREVRYQAILADGAGNCYLFWGPGYDVAEEDGLYCLEKYGTDGSMLWHAAYTQAELENVGDGLRQGTVTRDGRVFLYNYGAGGRVFSFGGEGELQAFYVPELESLEGVAVGKDGDAYAYCVAGASSVFASLDSQGELYPCPVTPLQVYDGYEDGICLRTGEGMLGYEPVSGETEFLWRWQDEYVDVDGGQVDRFFRGRETSVLLCLEQGYYDTRHTRQLLTFAYITQQDRTDYPGRQVLTLSSMNSTNQHLIFLVKQFNRQSRDYRVELVKEADGDSLEKKLLKGEGADLVELWGLYSGGLAENGAFEDLTAYYEASKVIDQGDVLECVREAGVIKGRNVAVVPAFYIGTMKGGSSVKAEDWTVWKFLETGLENQVFMVQKPSVALEYCMGTRYGEYFIDYGKGESYFDGEEFRRILELCGKWAVYGDDQSGIIYDSTVEGADQFLHEIQITSPWDVVSDKDPAYSTKLVGYPGYNGAEYQLWNTCMFAMNSKSGNKEGAWAFLEYLLSEELQSGIDWAFPVRKDSFERYLQDLYVDPDLLKQPFVVGLSAYEPVVPTEEDIAFVRQMADSAIYDSWGGTNNPVWKIVSEETQMYFAGDASLEDTVKKIQARVQLYLDER